MHDIELVLSFAAALALATVTSATGDIKGPDDRHNIPRDAVDSMVFFDQTEYHCVTIPTGSSDGPAFQITESLEGEVPNPSHIVYNPDSAALQIKHNHIAAPEARGFAKLYAVSDADLGNGPDRSFCNAAGIFSFDTRGYFHLATRKSTHDPSSIAARSTDGPVLAGVAAFTERHVSGQAVVIVFVISTEAANAMDYQLMSAGETETCLIEDGRVAKHEVLFKVDLARILPEATDTRGTGARLIREASNDASLVVGHTDDSGSHDFNLSLSMGRAQAVVDDLTSQYRIALDRVAGLRRWQDGLCRHQPHRG